MFFSKNHPLRQTNFFEPIVLGFAWLASMLVLGAVTKGVAPLLGIENLQEVMKNLEDNLTPDTVAAMRILQMLGQIFLFILPPILFLAFCNAKKPFQYLFLDQVPLLRNIFLGMGMMMVAIPVIQFVYWLNQQLPLPDFLVSAENRSNGLMEAMLNTTSTKIFLLNLLVMALLPAIGEELLFRGLIQRIMGRKRKQRSPNKNEQATVLKEEIEDTPLDVLEKEAPAKPHRAIWVTATLFSMMHMQFAGFFPRLFLGALLGYMLYWSASLIVPILAHFLYNGSQIVALYLHQKGEVATNIENIEQFPVALTVISIILLLTLCRFMYKTNEKQRTLYESRMEKSIQ